MKHPPVSDHDAQENPTFVPCSKALFFSRGDQQDPRLGECAHQLPAQKDASDFSATISECLLTAGSADRQFFLAGYPDDEGIQNNGGRTGAALAPDLIRKYFYKMTPNLLGIDARKLGLWDLGNLNLGKNPDLRLRHESAKSFAQITVESSATWISLGGGHDYGYADAAAFIEAMRRKQIRPLVINFDAHLDVRPVQTSIDPLRPERISSGTPFFRMLESCPDVDFAEIGIQSQCNSKAHLKWATERGVRVLTQEEVEVSGESFSSLVLQTLGDWVLRRRPVFISVDIDGFSSAYAPGCSQSWATGFTPAQFFPCLQTLVRRLDVKMLGIYEVSPPYDQDDRTAKLAAQILHRVIDPT
jgi:formiminoglutamase